LSGDFLEQLVSEMTYDVLNRT